MSLLRRRDLACEEAQDALVFDPIDQERVRLHRLRCEDCRTSAERIDEVKRAVIAVDAPGLDDVTRARIHARLKDRFDEMATANAQESWSWKGQFNWRWATAGAVAMLVALFAFLQASEILRYPGAPVPDRAVLMPYLVSHWRGFGRQEVGQLQKLLEVEAEQVVRAAVGTDTRVTLEGPGLLSVTNVTAEQIDLRLDRGRVLVDVGPKETRRLRVHTDPITVTVVGTLFAVSAAPISPKVAVLRGTVEVQTKGRPPLFIQAGESWQLGSEDTTDLETDVASHLEAHSLSARPPKPPWGRLVIVGSPRAATVRIGNAPLGAAPLTALLPIGRAELDLNAKGYASTKLVAQIQSDSTTSLGFELSAAPPPPPEKAIEERQEAKEPRRRATTDTASDLYTRAEKAMKTGDHRAATKLLQRIIRRHSDDPLADSALYELGRLSYDQGNKDEASAYLKLLLARDGDPAIRETGHHLLCRVAVDSNQRDRAVECLTDFRKAFPDSVHDQETLFGLASLVHLEEGCEAALHLLEEYLRRYPRGAFVRTVETRRQQCIR